MDIKGKGSCSSRAVVYERRAKSEERRKKKEKKGVERSSWSAEIRALNTFFIACGQSRSILFVWSQA
jgi:hypothetical protein